MCPPLLLLLLRLFILNTPHADNPTCKHPVDPLRDCFIMLHKRPSLVGNSPFATSQLLWQHLLSDSVCVQSSDAGREYITVCKWHRSHTDVAIVCTVSPALYSVCTAGNYAPLLLSHEYLKKQKKEKNSNFVLFSRQWNAAGEVSWETQAMHIDFYNIFSTHQARIRMMYDGESVLDCAEPCAFLI